jgi:hypothetical protein
VQAQLGSTYASDDEAIDAYITAPAWVSPHPLVEPEWIDADNPWRDQAVSGLVWYLSEADLRFQQSPHPLIDLARIVRRDPGAAEHPHGVLSWWLAQSGPDAVLPSVAGTPRVTLAELRATALAAAAKHRRQSAPLRRHRNTSVQPSYRDVLPPLPPAGDGPLVSIVLPTWNSARGLRQVVASVQAQSYAGWELVVVDDGSDDDTRHVLEGLTTYDPRVSYVALEHGGAGRARNEGISRARGKYVAFLDSDRTWRPEFLRIMLQNLETHGWEMAHAAVAVLRDGQTSYRAFEGSRDDLLSRNHIDLDALVVRRDLLASSGGFDETLRRAGDHDLVLRLSALAALHLVDYVGTEVDADRAPLSARDADSWTSVVTGRHLVDWGEIASAERVPGRISVILPTRGNVQRTVSFISELSKHRDRDLELVVVLPPRIRRSHRVIAETLAAVHGRTQVLHLSTDANPTLSANLGAARTTGDRLVLVRPGAVATGADLIALADALGSPGVDLAQPLLTDESDLVVSAGAVFADRTRPQAFLAGHSISDVDSQPAVEIPAPFSPVVAATWDAFAAAEGLDPLLTNALSEVDLAMRLRGQGRGRTVLVPGARARSVRADLESGGGYSSAVHVLEQRWPEPPSGSEEAWQAAGFTVVGHRNHGLLRSTGRPKPDAAPLDDVLHVPHALVVPLRPRAARVSESPPSLRWTIDIASPPGPKGEAWGDTHFARSLAAALGRQGQHVSVDSRRARHRSSRDLDDVLLVLRGLDRVHPRPGLLNVHWVISHPDLVSAQEAAAFDLRYAASTIWSQRMSSAWNLPIQALMQCTDPGLFNPERGTPDTGPRALFVGNSRKVYRSSVRSALAAGADVKIYGTGWRDFVPADKIAGSYLDNTELGTLYASSTVVLNDHWEDMRREGFVSNRLFDAAACGARVVSDDCPGIAELFDGQVQVFRRDDEVGALLADPVSLFPGTETRRGLAQSVIRNHSFDQRASTLIEDAARELRLRGGVR